MLWVILCSLLAYCSATSPKVKPHILYIVADDMGWSDIGFTQGNEDSIYSPYLNGLAAQGLLLNRHYTAWLCTPSRASIMTGRYPISLGIQHDVFDMRTHQCLNESQQLLPAVVKSNGYATHLLGKCHLGYARWSCLPCRRGYDSWLGYTQGWIDYIDHVASLEGDFVDFMQCSNDLETGFEWKTLEELGGIYSGDVYRERAQAIITEHEPTTPLFLTLFLQTPHYPYFSPTKYLDPDCVGHRCILQGMIAAMEDLIKKVIDHLKDKDMWDNTILIFHSDNGAPQENDFQSNYPLKGFKNELWEGGVRTAAFVYSPNFDLMPNRGVSDGYVHITDWFKTIVTLSGGWENWVASGETFPDDLDSIDQTEHILNNITDLRTTVLSMIDPVTRTAAYYKGPYKLLIGNQNNLAICDSNYVYELDINSIDLTQRQLYNVFEDPSELTDLSEEKVDIVHDMVQELIPYLNHQQPLQCQFGAVNGAYPNEVVPWFLPWDYDVKLAKKFKRYD